MARLRRSKMNGLRLEILTPQTLVYDGEVDAVVAPLSDGWIGILAGHRPFSARLMRGHVLVRSKGSERVIATIGGSLSVQNNAITLLTGAAGSGMTYAELEASIGAEVEQIRAMEQEAERHFDRVYRTLADTFRPAQRRGF